MNIDERLEAIAQSVELLTHDVHAMQEMQRRMLRREAGLRNALLNGIAGFMQGLAEDEAEDDRDGEA